MECKGKVGIQNNFQTFGMDDSMNDKFYQFNVEH